MFDTDEEDAYWREVLYKMTFAEVCEWFSAHKIAAQGDMWFLEKCSDDLTMVDFCFQAHNTYMTREARIQQAQTRMTVIAGGQSKFNSILTQDKP